MSDARLSDRRRVASLREMGLLTDTPEEGYDRFTRLAAEIVDAREHPTVNGNPAIEELHVIAYLGVPLITRRGETLGSLCAIDREPREWTERDRSVLEDLAAATVTEVELRRTTQEAVTLAERLEAALRDREARR